MKHTPGPWEYRTIDDSIGGIDDSDGNPIGQSFQVKGDVKGENRIANAKLMASAPDLLQAASGAYARLLEIGQYDARHTLQGQQELARLRDAIAKAVGRDNQEIQDEFETRKIMRNPE